MLACSIAAATSGGCWGQQAPAFVPASAASRDVEGPPFDRDAPAPGSASAALYVLAPEPTVGTTSGPGLRWYVPLSLNGSIAYELRSDRVENERARFNQLLTATVQAASYIYQPWLAIVNGQLGLTTSRAQGGEHGGVDRDQFVSSALRLGVFPRSRFPFEMRYEVSDSRIDPALGGGQDYRSRTFGVLQRYRPAAGEFNLSASYERRAQDGAEIGEDTQEALLVDFSSRWRRQEFNASLSRALNRRRASHEESDVRAAVLRHRATEGEALSIENSLNFSETDDRLLAGRSDQRVTQWSSVAMWRPPKRPYNVTASIRGFRFAGTDFDNIESLSAAVAANYDVTPQLRAFASASTQRTDRNEGNSGSASAGGSYQGDMRSWRRWSHTWYAGSSASRSRQAGRVDDTLAGQLGQSVSRLWGPVNGSTLSVSMSQNASASRMRDGHPGALPGDDPNSRALAHTLGLAWNHVDAGGNAAARLTLSDAHQFDGDRSRLQLVNLQISGSHEIDRRRSWNGNLTLQRLFQRARTTDILPAPVAGDPPTTVFDFDRLITHSASGELSYRQMQVWDVPQLRFASILRLSGDAQHQRRVLVPLPERETGSWENRLDWRVGRLDAAATLRASRVDGRCRTALTLQVIRSFGD